MTYRSFYINFLDSLSKMQLIDCPHWAKPYSSWVKSSNYDSPNKFVCPPSHLGHQSQDHKQTHSSTLPKRRLLNTMENLMCHGISGRSATQINEPVPRSQTQAFFLYAMPTFLNSLKINVKQGDIGIINMSSVSLCLSSRGSYGVVPVFLGLTGVSVGWAAHSIQISLDAYSPCYFQHLVGEYYP